MGGEILIDKIMKTIITLIGGLIGFGLVAFLESLELFNFYVAGWIVLIFKLGFSLLFAIIFLLFSSKIIKKGRKVVGGMETELQKFSTFDVVSGAIGLILGLVIAYLISQPLYKLELPFIGPLISVVLFGIFGYLGVRVTTGNREEIARSLGNFGNLGNMSNLKRNPREKRENSQKSYPKILDTSVIIDGRIADICKTGFIEGPLIIPQFVLGELQHIADSSDGLKRNRGRRGLDILSVIQKELDIEIIIHEKKFDDIAEVDSKLLKLTQLLNGKILTNDYNLNKVAAVQNIPVLNINELANAVKPIVLPGEEMVVDLVKDGKESGQALAYLDDGTMIVVESGRKFIGKTIHVIVTSVLQTSAGRMIFAKPKSMIDNSK